MQIRRQLPVASPLTAGNIAGALLDTIARRDVSQYVRATLAAYFGAGEVVLTDSGTSALVLALRLLAQPGATVAMPAYACVDLIAAARRADVRVALFDVDPHTLSPDMDSVQRVLAQGASCIVVAHLYGFPADMPALMKLAREVGVPVIEDAAQHASASIQGKPSGSFGDVTVLSFGRGKGTTSGRGGALLVRGASTTTSTRVHAEMHVASSMSDIIIAAASWTLGRPSIYGVPASIPALHLGETVYHEAGEPRRMSSAAVALLRRALADMQHAAAVRRANALILRDAADQSRHLEAVRAIDSGESGYLRFPVLPRGEIHDAPPLGIVRGYPKPLSAAPEMQDRLTASREPLHGAHELASRLVTLPTHHMVTSRALASLSRWLGEQ
jgi:perosamine synthetase